MAHRASWDAALIFGGFPVHLKAYSLMESKGADSFKNLCPCHKQPVTMPKTCRVDGTILQQAQLLKGVEVTTNDVRVLDDAAVAAIKATETSETLEILGLPLVETVPTNLATGHYRIVPNDKVPGSDGPTSVIWNGLIANGRAVITEFVQRAGSREKLLAITADVHGLTGLVLPYVTDMKEVPEHQFTANEQAAQMFEAFAGQQGISLDSFAHADFEDQYRSRRDAAIQAALSGKPIEVKAPTKAPVADLMAAMTAALESSKAPAKPARKRAAKAVK